MNRDVAVFLRRSFLFALPLLALIGYVEVRLSRLPTSYGGKRTYLERQLDSIEVLALGSSHSLNGVDPSCFSRPAFNAAGGSQSLYYDTRLVLKYIDRMPHLRYVLIEISYFNLWYQLADSPESWRGYFYYRYWGIGYRGLARLNPKMFSYIALYGPYVVFEYAKKNFNVKPVGVLRNGFTMTSADTLTVRAQVTDSFGKARVALHTARAKSVHLQENVADLSILLEELRRRHVEAVFITLPVLESYSRYLDPAISLRNRQVVDSLCSVYGCRFVDYSLDKRFVVADFYNCDHLNARGARKFSGILNRDFITPVK